MTNNGTSFFLFGAFIIAGTFGSHDNRGNEYISGVYGTASGVRVEQNARVNPLNTNESQKTQDQPTILMNQQPDGNNQPLIYHQASNQQAILISDQQNPSQQTIFLSSQPQQVLMSNQQPTHQANKPHTNLLYIQNPNEQQTLWVSQPNIPNQVFMNQPSSQPNKPVLFTSSQPILLTPQPDNQVIVTQPANTQPIIQEPNQQSYLFVSSQPNQQSAQPGIIQVNKPVVTGQPNQPTYWIASQPNQPTLMNLQTNPPMSGQTDQPRVVNIVQPTLKPNHGNFLVIPIQGNVNPGAQQGETYYVPIQ